MPKLPGGMFRRGKTYYLQRQRDGKRQWINLGQDLQEACRQRKDVLSSGTGSGSQAPVRKLAAQWLGTYVSTMRAPVSQRKAAQRVRDYLVPFLGEKPISRVTKEGSKSGSYPGLRAQSDQPAARLPICPALPTALGTPA